MKTDAPLIHCLEELESLDTEGQVHHLMQRPHILLFIEPKLAQFPQLFLHKTSPSDRPARSGHSHIPWGFVSHPSREFLSRSALSVSECRKAIIFLKTARDIGSWFERLVCQ